MWFRRIGMSRRGWRLCFPHSPAFAQIKHRSVELCPSLSAVYWFCSLCNKNRLKLRNIVHSFKRFCNLLEKNFRALMLSWGFYAFITGHFIYKFLGKIEVFCWQWIGMVVMGFTSPSKRAAVHRRLRPRGHWHRRCTVQP